MNAENTKRLLEGFPRLFCGFYKPMTETCMCWGFDCRDGWFQIIWDLSVAIEEQARNEGRSAEAWPEASQVKEKFGTLRFYLFNGSDEMEALISKAEEASARTCEVCGAPGTLETTGWWCTACEEHKNG